MIQLITNHSKPTHLEILEDILPNADEVYISVAFLKMSGLRKFTRYFNKSARFNIIAGANFGLTDPDALTELLAYSSKGVKAYLNKLSSKVIFHPKMYLIRSGGIGHIIIGSANMTNSGLNNNVESSLYYKCGISETIWKDALFQFERFIQNENADIINERIISIYREYHKRQKKINDQLEPVPDVSTNPLYDLERLKSWLDKKYKAHWKDDFKFKRNHYKQARIVLDIIAEKKHSLKGFTELVEELVGKKGDPGLWYSNGMFRHKEDIFKQQNGFRELVNTIKNGTGLPAGELYDRAKMLTKHIKGVGPNFIGEIMMTYAPLNFANINRNPITVLRDEGNVDLPSHSQYFSGSHYHEYNSMVKEITQKLGFKDMLEADYFFNIIYQDIK